MKLVCTIGFGIAVAASAWGQHSGSGGHAAAAHSSGSFSSGRSFSASAPASPSRVYSAPAYRPSLQSQQYGARSSYSSPIGAPPFGGTQPNPGRRHYPNGGNRPYYYSRGVYAVPGFLNYGFGYPDDSYYGPQQAAAPDAAGQAEASDDGPGPYDQAYAPVPPRPAYESPATAPDLPEQPQVTLLFKDGRPTQQVQNYAVTRTTLYVLDGARRREVPLDDLDLPRTEQANRDAGVDFVVPAATE